MTSGQHRTNGEPLPLCGHTIGPYDVLVRVQGDPKDFLICQACWQPGRSYEGPFWRVDRLFGAEPEGPIRPTLPVPCLGCSRRVIRAKRRRLSYITCSPHCALRASKMRAGEPPGGPTKPCEECGHPYRAQTQSRYCQMACRSRAYRNRRKNTAHAP